MIDAISANLLPYSVQVFLVVLAGAVAATLTRVDAAHVRYAYWRGIGLLCLALPFVQPRMAPIATASTEGAGVAAGVAADISVLSPSPAFSDRVLPGIEWIVWVLALGIAVRLAWVAGGLLKLRALRRATHAADRCDDDDDLQRVIGARAQVRYVDRLRQPVTFGLLRPVVLLPAALRDHPTDVRRAVLAHELLHVERRDWAWVLVEEVVRAVFWFHPAMWLLISHVQLVREEVVDETAVLVTGQRRAYVEALLAFADATPLAPAPAFARRRHLFRRMMQISKEAVMSSKQIVASCALMAIVVMSGGWYAVGAFPLVDAAQQAHEMIFVPKAQDDRGPLERTAVPITPENPVPRRVHVVPAEYPQEARSQNATAVVTVQATLDAVGRVAESRPARLHVRGTGWEIGTDTVTPQGMGKLLASDIGIDAATARPIVEAFVRSAVAAVQQWRYDPPFEAPISFPVTISFSLGASERGPGIPPPPPAAPPPGYGTQIPQDAGWTSDGALRVGGSIKPPTKIRDVRPAYPAVAREAGVQGVVIIEARIGPDGHITDARVLKSVPLLDEAALDAVKQWVFTPTLMNGNPVPVIMTMTVNFTLQ